MVYVSLFLPILNFVFEALGDKVTKKRSAGLERHILSVTMLRI